MIDNNIVCMTGNTDKNLVIYIIIFNGFHYINLLCQSYRQYNFIYLIIINYKEYPTPKSVNHHYLNIKHIVIEY